jgi:hypothetical protein
VFAVEFTIATRWFSSVSRRVDREVSGRRGDAGCRRQLLLACGEA